MASMKTPGVYVVENSALPNAVVEVATAVPAFIGYTERADKKGMSLTNKPWRISSLAEYQQYFGGGPTPRFEITPAVGPAPGTAFKAGGKEYLLAQGGGNAGGRYLLYYGLLHFFQNGGGPCYIVSVGDYATDVDGSALQAGIERLVAEREPTLLVIPDAVLLGRPDCIAVQKAMLSHCGGRMRNRVAILDVWEGWRSQKDSNCIASFRNALGTDHLDFGAAYYPWVNTNLVQAKDLGLENIAPESRDLLIDLLRCDLGLPSPLPATADPKAQRLSELLDDIRSVTDAPGAEGLSPKAGELEAHKARLNASLQAASPLFMTIFAEMAIRLNLLPPSAAVAGIYAMVDSTRGVWKAPANVSLNGVISPAVNLSHEEQEELNVSVQGKSINAIRSFVGQGVLVWGARTLDGNSQDWRYINVRRTMIMLEESCRLALGALVFEPNEVGTWAAIKGMLQNFLTGIWKRGGLAGAAPDDAFSVHVGLGETMTAQDILDGVLRVTVLVAITRPAEFIAITFMQQMQKS
jgi:phage tail sheath protein FI